MYNLVNGIKALIKLDEVSIDNAVFRLHYKLSVIWLIIFALMVTSKEYLGEPIKCYAEKDKSDVFNSYCWIFSTHTVRNTNGDSKHGLKNHPGVRPISNNSSTKDSIKYLKYYQWVVFILLFQALLFYLPYYFWLHWEGGRLRALVMEVSCPVLNMLDGLEDENHRGVSCNIQSIMHYWEYQLHYHNGYAFRYVFCEILNMVNVVSQFFMLEVVLGGDFFLYGSVLLGKSNTSISEISERIFPKVAKCNFEHYGPSGAIVNKDLLCVLPLNVFNEKIFAILWFWFMILSIITGCALLYRLACYASPNLRIKIIRSQARTISSCRVKAVIRTLNYGDWFILHQMAKNMNSLVFTKLLYEMADKFSRPNTL